MRIGVATLRGDPGTVPGVQGRDRLVKHLNRRKRDKKSQFTLEAVVLEASSPEKAIAEAREKNCEYALSTHLTNLETTYQHATSNGGEEVPIFNATVEYQLIRVSDGSGFASGSVKAQDQTSSQDAVWQALGQVAGKAFSKITSGEGTPTAPVVAATAVIPVGGSVIQKTTIQEVFISPNFCAWLPSQIAHAAALRAACDYAVTLPEKMPNFVCGQETARYRGESRAPVDLISTSVRYEDGKETYSDIKINGRPVPGGADQTQGLRSTGEFGGDLQNIFDLSNNALFGYSGEGQVGDRAAWIFTYRVAEQKIPLWRFRDQNQVTAPPYSGELWLDQQDSAVLRLHSVAWQMPSAFSIRSADLEIDYKRIAFGDGTNFVLPVGSTLTTVFKSKGEESSRNTVQFRDCHKFGARGRLVLKSASGGAGAGSPVQAAPDPVSLANDLEESEAIYASVAKQALQESDARREADQKHMLDAVNARTLARLSELLREQQQIQTQRQAIAAATSGNAAQPSVSSTQARTVLKVSASLVLVSVVLRDASGHAVGNVGRDSFRLFDNGKPQVITHFSVETAGASTSAREDKQETTKVPANIEEPVQPVPRRSAPPAVERDTAYLFDDIHASFADLASARDAAARHLNSLKENDRAAVFTTSGTVAVDFTGDRENVLAALHGLRPHPIIPESSCPPISYYMADLMVNQGDLEANGVAVEEAIECAFHGMGTGAERQQAQRLASAKAFEVLNAGNVESKNALAILRNVIRRTEAMPGQRSVVLVSPGFLAVTPDMRQDVMEIVDRALHSGIVVNTLDARGLYTVGLSGNSGHLGQDRLQFDSAETQAQNDIMAELASGTGGIFFHSNNDLEEGFRRTAAAPEFVYILGFAPHKLDGKFHKLKVTLNGGGGYEVQARRGYSALKPAVTK